ncbi:hypothetical protein D9M70_606440 [compost metagenome]
MHLLGKRDMRGVSQHHVRTERHTLELAAAVPVEPHHPAGTVLVGHNHNSVFHRDMQEGQHVALRERREKQLLRVEPRAVAVERGVS